MRILFKAPTDKWKSMNIIDNLRIYQQLVDGYIECVGIPEYKCVIICNEEGRIRGLPCHCVDGLPDWFPARMFGNVILAGVDGEEFCDVPQDIVDKVLGAVE